MYKIETKRQRILTATKIKQTIDADRRFQHRNLCMYAIFQRFVYTLN